MDENYHYAGACKQKIASCFLFDDFADSSFAIKLLDA